MRLRTLLLCFIVLALAGCVARGNLARDNIAPGVTRVLDRYDAYVSADQDIDTAERAARTRNSDLLRAIVTGDEQYIHVDDVDPLLTPILAQHDQYVSDDQSLDEMDQSSYLRTTDLIRRVVAEAKRGPPK